MAASSADGLHSLQLADALCARLCHDFSSPLGTLMGALEMVADDPASIEDAMPIATETTAALAARLRLLRAAWAGECGPLSRTEIVALAAGLPPRVRVDLQGLRNSPFEGPLARTLLNLLLLGVEALPRGGVVTLAAGDDAITVSLAGKAASWPAGLADALADPYAVPLDNPRAVQPPLTVILAQAAGLTLSMGPPGPEGGPSSLLLTAS